MMPLERKRDTESQEPPDKIAKWYAKTFWQFIRKDVQSVMAFTTDHRKKLKLEVPENPEEVLR